MVSFLCFYRMISFNSSFLSESHTKDLIWTLQLPNDSNLVADSAKAKLIFNSDILGSTLEVKLIVTRNTFK